MNEPEALSKLDMTELERRLLDAARRDRVPSDLGLRIAGALTQASLAPAAAATNTLAPGALLFSKTGLWGFLSIALLAGAGALYAGRPGTDAAAAPRAAASQARAASTLAPHAPASAPVTAPEPEPALPVQPDRRAAGAGAARADEAALREEIDLLDRAREALARGAAQRALRVLGRHRARFAHGTLAPEAEALRIEALAQLGDARARSAAQRFISTYPAHPLRERVGALAE
jgi:hypothetical protein